MYYRWLGESSEFGNLLKAGNSLADLEYSSAHYGAIIGGIVLAFLPMTIGSALTSKDNRRPPIQAAQDAAECACFGAVTDQIFLCVHVKE